MLSENFVQVWCDIGGCDVISLFCYIIVLFFSSIIQSHDLIFNGMLSFLSVITNTVYLEYSFCKAVLITLKKDFQRELSFVLLSSTDRGGLLFSLFYFRRNISLVYEIKTISLITCIIHITMLYKTLQLQKNKLFLNFSYVTTCNNEPEVTETLKHK